MQKVITRIACLCKTPLYRSSPAFSTSTVARDLCNNNEAPLIDNDDVVGPPEQQKLSVYEKCLIPVPTKVDLTPISGVPHEHIVTRLVRIYRPSKNAMQSGTNNLNHWEMEFDNRQRWENPLMGWTSTGDPLSTLKVTFNSPEEAIAHCQKNGWLWYIDQPKREKEVKKKDYGLNFSWNRRTRVSTK